MIKNLLVVGIVVAGIAAQYQELSKFTLRFFIGFYLLFAIGWIAGWVLGASDKGVRKAMVFSTPQRNSGIALLSLTGLVVQFAMRKL